MLGGWKARCLYVKAWGKSTETPGREGSLSPCSDQFGACKVAADIPLTISPLLQNSFGGQN